jgi:hypothetical protein
MGERAPDRLTAQSPGVHLRGEPQFLATTVTDPAFAGPGLGCLIAWWALDHAAHRNMAWVRRGTGPYPGLVHYYTHVQGWHLIRAVERDGVTAYALARRAERQPGLSSIFATAWRAWRLNGP